MEYVIVSDLAIGLSLFAFLMLSYWIVRWLGGDARRVVIKPRSYRSEDVFAETVTSATHTRDVATPSVAQAPVAVVEKSAAVEDEATVTVVAKAAPAASAPPVVKAPPTVESAIVDIALLPVKPLASTTPLETQPAPRTATVEIAKPAAPAAPVAPQTVPAAPKVEAPLTRVEVIREAPKPAPAVVASVAAAAAATAASIVAKAAAPAAASPPTAPTPFASGRADIRATLPPGYTRPDATPATAPVTATSEPLPAHYQRASTTHTIAPPPPATQPKAAPVYGPLPPLKPNVVSAPPPSIGPSPILPASVQRTLAVDYRAPVPVAPPRAFGTEAIALPAHFARGDWMATLSPERRAALPPTVVPPKAEAPAASPTVAQQAVAPVAKPDAPAAVKPAPVATAPVVPVAVTAAAQTAAVAAAASKPNAPRPSTGSWYASQATAAAVVTPAAATTAAMPAAAEAKVDAPSPYTERASTLPRSEATPAATKSAAAAEAEIAIASTPAAPQLVSTARRGTRVIGGDGDEPIDLTAAPRPQTPSIWDQTKPRRALTDDEILASEILSASAAPSSIKAERVPIRSEPLLVRPDVSRTLSPPPSAKPAAPATSAAKGAQAPAPAAPAPQAKPASDYSALKPIPVDIPLVSTASGTAGGHAISQARMGVEPPQPVAIVKPSVSATVQPKSTNDK